MNHVFVTRGDITRLSVDAWLLPTDRTVSVTDSWYSAAFTRDLLEPDHPDLEDLRSERVLAAAAPTRKDGPTPVLTAVPYEGATSFEDLRPRLLAGLRVAAEVAKEVERRRVAEAGPPHVATERPLIATPAFGVSGGGANPKRGEVIAGILETAETVARDEGVDVVVCLKNAVDHALAQRIRLNQWGAQPPLSAEEQVAVDRLVAMTKDNRLVPFMGSGVSATAGLPTWAELLDRLAADLNPPLDGGDWFKGLSALDQAHVVRGTRSREEFGKAIAKHTSADRYGLAPALSASLPTHEAVTLNLRPALRTRLRRRPAKGHRRAAVPRLAGINR